MLKDIGQKIRQRRKHAGYGLNDFAEKIGVSTGYLSNLENGKTETINFQLLEKIQDELLLFPELCLNLTDAENELDLRLDRINHLLRKLHKLNPEQAEFLIAHVEKGLDIFSDQGN